MVNFLLFVVLGFFVGGCGTLIGVGGGFILVPILLFLHPEQSPEFITSISLAVVFCNALAGSIAYARQGRVDYRSGILFSAAAIPGAILGAYSTAYLPRHIFDVAFGVVMIAGSAFLLIRPGKAQEALGCASPFRVTRNIVGVDGTAHAFHYNRIIALGVSFLVGYLSSVLGIGGGILHVPVLIHLLNFPIHIATATSHFVLAVTTLAGTGVHVYSGMFSQGVGETLPLAAGVLLGAPVGARISRRVQDIWVTRGLAVALALVGIRTMIAAF